MNRKFFTLLVIAALSIAAGSMACKNPINELETEDESDGAT